MTDEQQKLFQKMLKKEITIWLDTSSPVFYEGFGDGYFTIIPPSSNKWNDYNEAWKAYENVPLIKALR
jgi:hypothetical protein